MKVADEADLETTQALGPAGDGEILARQENPVTCVEEAVGNRTGDRTQADSAKRSKEIAAGQTAGGA